MGFVLGLTVGVTVSVIIGAVLFKTMIDGELQVYESEKTEYPVLALNSERSLKKKIVMLKTVSIKVDDREFWLDNPR